MIHLPNYTNHFNKASLMKNPNNTTPITGKPLLFSVQLLTPGTGLLKIKFDFSL